MGDLAPEYKKPKVQTSTKLTTYGANTVEAIVKEQLQSADFDIRCIGYEICTEELRYVHNGSLPFSYSMSYFLFNSIGRLKGIGKGSDRAAQHREAIQYFDFEKLACDSRVHLKLGGNNL